MAAWMSGASNDEGVVSNLPAARRSAKQRPKAMGPTAIARRLALAHHVEALIASGELAVLANAAKRPSPLECGLDDL